MSSWQLICFLCGQGISTAIRIWLEERLRYLRSWRHTGMDWLLRAQMESPMLHTRLPLASAGPHESKTYQQRLSVVPLLVADTQIPSDVRQALVENRLQDAAIILMEEYGLSCVKSLISWTCPRAKRIQLARLIVKALLWDGSKKPPSIPAP